MIRKVLMSTVAMIAISGTAFAADLPSRRAPPVFVPPPIPVFSWTGFYIGGQVGYGFGRDNSTLYATALPGFPVPIDLGHPNGIIGGGHIGYNFSTQSLPLFGSVLGGFTGAGGVIGIEGDVDGSDYHSTFNPGFGFVETDRTEIQGSVRGRLGVAVDRALFYATGGAAFADLRHTYTNTTATGGIDSFSRARIGYTVGGGIEYAITTQFSLRAEYRYTEFARYSEVLANSFPPPNGSVSASHKIEQQRVQVGFSYKFDTPVAPVVARY